MPSGISRHCRSRRCRTAQTQRQRSASARRQRVRMESAERSIRQIHSPPSIGGSTRCRNSALTWKDRVSNPVPAVASTLRRRKGCAAPCCSPIQTSVCELTSRLSRWFIRGLVIGIEADTHQSKYEYTLAGTCACSETSAFVVFDPAVALPSSESGSVAHRQNAKPPSRVQHRGRTYHQVVTRLSKR